MFVHISETQPIDIYHLLTGGVSPRPIAWISSKSACGIPNLAPFSFFTVASCVPPILAITQVSPSNKLAKDTLNNIKETKDCVVNIVKNKLTIPMNASSGEYAPEINEFDELDIAHTKSTIVQVDGVAESNIRFECTLHDVIKFSDKPMGGIMIFLAVLGVFVDESVIADMKIIPEALDTIGKLGQNFYTTTKDTFELARPNI